MRKKDGSGLVIQVSNGAGLPEMIPVPAGQEDAARRDPKAVLQQIQQSTGAAI